ncbi:MAG TPA: tetratricopeptide repeat protein, partial [Candidatus Solibacter sp.]|nr:tetratricopeptide repeat protein [Candidatus Solibacter sp.]
EGGRRGAVLLYLSAAACAGLFAALTISQCRTWQSSATLWRHALRYGASESPNAHNQLGLAMAAEGKVTEAISEFRTAIALAPAYDEPHSNLGVAFGEQGRMGEAAVEFGEAIRLNPKYAEAYNNLGTVLVKQGDLRQALEKYATSLRIDPEYRGALENLKALADSGKLKPDLAGPAAGILERPRDAAAFDALAIALRKSSN